MSEEPSPFQHSVEICDMTWFAQVGLFLNCKGEDRGSWERSGAEQGVVKILSYNMFNKLSQPFLGTGHGPMVLRDEVRDWLLEQGWPYEFARTACDWNCQCRGLVKFTEAHHAMMFKLTWYDDDWHAKPHR